VKRWNKKKQMHEENEKIDVFIKDIVKICKKHNLSISHEDGHGSFEIEIFSDDNIKWLNNATDNT